MVKYKKVPNNKNAIEIDGKVVLSFDPRYKEYLKWKDENPDLEQKLADELEQEVENKRLYNNGAPHIKGNVYRWYNEEGQLTLSCEMDGDKKEGKEKSYYDNGKSKSKNAAIENRNLQGKVLMTYLEGEQAFGLQ